MRVVNLASWEIFEEQPEDYRLEVLPRSVPRLAVEAGITLGWDRYVGEGGDVHGIDHFGSSAPWKVIAEKLGFTPEAVAEKARRLISQR